MKVSLISLGCDKNLTDSEKMLALLSRAGHEFTDDPAEAEAIIVNSCCFIGDAKEESIHTILEMASYKESGRCRVLIVTGCLAQRYRQDFFEELPEVDGIVGTNSWDEICRVLEEAEKGTRPEAMRSIDAPVPETGSRVLTGGGHTAFLKIAEGCDKHCTYCVIPSVRGAYRSRRMEDLIREAEELAERGVKELILVAQETTLYGKDLTGRKMLPELLARLSEIEGIRWIRIQYAYPEEITEELIAAIRDLPKVCHYLDLPIQSGSDRILRLMGRKTRGEEIRALVSRLREEIPDICLRTTLITGFPGETEEDHEASMDLVDELEFDRLGVFTYSAEEETPAAAMDGQLPEKVKEERRDEIMELQQDISAWKAEQQIGRVLTVLIEGRVADEDACVGRTYMDSPDVDGYVFVQTDRQLMTGDMLDVRITGSRDYDLIGELI